MAGRGEVRYKLVAEVEQFKSAIKEVKDQVSKLGDELAGRLGPAGSVLQAMGPAGLAAAAGLGASVATAGAFANEMKLVIDAAGQLNDLSARVGVSTQALQELAYAGSLVGVSQEAIIGAMGKAQVALADGNAKTIEALDKLGLSLTALQQMSPEEQFRSLADAIAGIKNPTEQAGAAAAIFGKSFREVMPLIVSDFRGAADEAHAFGQVMSSDLVAAGDRAGDNLTRMSKAFEGFKNELAGTVITMPEFQDGLAAIVDIMGTLAALARDNAEYVRAFFAPLAIAGEAAKLAGGSSARAAAFSASGAHNQQVLEGRFSKAQMSAMAEADKLQRLFADALKEEEKQQKAAAKAASEHQKELDKLRGTIRHTYDELVNMGPMEDYFDLPANNVLRSPGLTAGMKELVPFRVDGGIEIDLEREGKKAGEAVRSGFGSALDSLPGVIVGALQGGGNVFQSVGATLLGGLFSKDSELVKKLSSGLSSLLGKGIGSALGSIIPGLGTALGGLAGGLLDGLLKNFNEKKGKILGAIVGGPLGFVFGGMLGKQAEHKRVNDMRDQFFEAHGGWQALQKQLSTLSNQDLVKKIFDAKTVEQFNRAVKEAEGLLGLQSEAQQKLQEAIDKYGFSIDELGPKFQQQKLDEMAGGLLQDYKLLTASGIEQNTVLAKMGPAFQDYVNTALKAVAALPEAMRPIIEQLIASGQLLDENGNAFTSLEQSGISFTQTLSEGLQSLISKIDELVRALTGAGSAAGRISIPNGGSLGNGKGLEEQPRSFVGGSGGFQNFGSGTPAVLHGVEAVIRPGDLRSMGGPNVTYAPVITVYGAGNADEIRDVVMTSLRDNAAGMRDYVATVRG